MGFEFNANDVHIQQALTDFALKFVNEDAIWRNVAPIKKVTKRSDKFWVFDERRAFEQTPDETAPNSDAHEIQLTQSTDNYSVTDRALGAWVPVEAIENADDPLKPELDAQEAIRERLENNQEVRVANALFQASVWAAGQKTTLAGATQWSDSASDPISAILAEIDNMIVRPNTLVVNADVWRAMRLHPKVTAAIFPLGGNAGTSGAVATVDQLAAVLELDQIVVGRRRVDTANPGQTASFSRAWGKHALLCRMVENPGLNDVVTALTFAETITSPVRDFDAKKGVKGSVYVKDGWNEDIRIVASDIAFFWENASA